MGEVAEEITITIPVSEAAKRHIETLQATLTKRNTQIEYLAARLEEASAGEPNQKALQKEYKRGWQDAANQLMSATQSAAQALGKVRKDAFDIYLQSEKRDF
ncbi:MULTISPECIES: hypothetical protein [unclassified Cryobacterium]|uniref:hypothetical protein n=1 Tax=unclassified Cryobacterium TaxID=2649013 RepID=UPI00106B1BBB|nr:MULTISPECIES: hypothetical protein [unclassified Cryobacterium]TFB96551.1 hypothetical protein E3O39_10795 [Cryobacterium sp. MDB2-A-1]TFC12835.1 hypothetical protein E3O35_07955 [Cryobacterium sp. MDB2-A-2]